MPKKQLIVDIDRDSVRFTRLDGISVEQQFHFEFKDKTDFGYKNQLDLFLVKTDFRSMDWDEYSLSWFSEKSTLLPFSIYNETNPIKVFELAYGKGTSDDDIDFNRIPEFSVTNIYEIPLWVKSFFVMRFPRIIMQHEGSHAIRGLISGAGSDLNLLLSLHENHFLILATHNKELKYYNTFEYQTAEDIIYHTAHLIQQNNWQDVKGNFRFVHSLLSTTEKVAEIKKLFEKLPPFKNFSFQESKNLLSQFQILCV